MRLGTIDRIDESGDHVQVYVSVHGDVEGPATVADMWGTHVELSPGQPIALLDLDAAHGEFVAIPLAWRKAGYNRDFVALKQDVDALNGRMDAMETQLATQAGLYNTHVHLFPAGGGGAPTDPTLSVQAPVSTAALLTGSNRLKATHE